MSPPFALAWAREPAPVTIAILPVSRSLMASLRPPRGRIPSGGARGYHEPAVKRVLIAEFAEPVDPAAARAALGLSECAISLFHQNRDTTSTPPEPHIERARAHCGE